MEIKKSKIKIVASVQILMMLASELGKAKLGGDENRIKEAQKAHDEYRDLCLSADEMITGLRWGDL